MFIFSIFYDNMKKNVHIYFSDFFSMLFLNSDCWNLLNNYTLYQAPVVGGIVIIRIDRMEPR